MARRHTQLRQQLEELRGRLEETDGAVSHQELKTLLTVIAGILDQLEADEVRLVGRLNEFDGRLLAVENSRFFQILRLPGQWLLEWRGRLGQWLLHSPLHPLYARLTKTDAGADPYQQWLRQERFSEIKPLPDGPLISVLLPVHNPQRQWLEAAVDSMMRQSYPRWELCACDDASRDPWVGEYFASKAAGEPRIRFVRSSQNLGISEATNRAGTLAEGEYIGFLDQDDLLAEHALFSIAEAARDRWPDLIYSDEDYLDEDGRRVQPSFKPAFSPDLLRCCMYMGHLLVIRRARLEEVGWLRSAFDGSQDYDLALRVTRNTGRVRHVPRVLYHWRRHKDSTAACADAKPFTHVAGRRALSEDVAHEDNGAHVEDGALPNSYRVRWPVPPDLKASLVICSRNARLLERCFKSIHRRTAHPCYEIIVVAHQVGDTEAMNGLLERSGVKSIPYSGPFHFSIMNNLGADHATGEVLVFLNDDVEPLTPEWLGALLGQARRRSVGVVGAKLLYPSGAVQHAGMVTGIMNGAGHPGRHLFAASYWNWLSFPRDVSAVTGACLAIRKDLFRMLGGFDQSFPVNYNDADLCLRVRQAGYEVILEPAALLRHDECRTRQPGVRLEEREHWEARWAAWLNHVDPFYSPHLTHNREDASLELTSHADLSARSNRL